MMYDCRTFKGDKPCEWAALEDLTCNKGCRHYLPTDGRTLIIKLGALGDVVRTTPILHELWARFPHREVWWLTRHPEVIPDAVDVVLPFNLESILTLQATSFDRVFNLDKDKEACALTYQLNAVDKFGFTLHQGHPLGIEQQAERKIKTGIDDAFSKENTLSYQQELFRICWLGEFIPKKHECILPEFERWEGDKKKVVVGVNTSCGDRWQARRWRWHYWREVLSQLKNLGYEVVLLGDEKDDESNKLLRSVTGVHYFGAKPLLEFMNMLDYCDIVVTRVTATLHLALGMKKKVVLLNNIFNKNEFELYGRGVVVEPERFCNCYYGEECTNDAYQCMDYLYPIQVLNAVRQLEKKNEA